jgi:hypothetical protein
LSLRTAFRYLWSIKWEVALSIFIALLIGETWVRIHLVAPRLEYQIDRELNGRLAPNQRGTMMLGSPSPPITLNSEGFRGGEIDWNKTIIIALGGSQTFGSGVADNQTSSFFLENMIVSQQGMENFQVVNAAHPGHGPTHHLVILNRIINKTTPSLIIARVDIGMRNFKVPKESEKNALVEATKVRHHVRKITKFLPLVITRVQRQLNSIKKSFIPNFINVSSSTGKVDRSKAKFMWEENRDCWEEMANLAQSRQIPLVFSVTNLMGNEAVFFIKQKLEELCETNKECYLMYLGPEVIGLENVPKEFQKQEYRNKYTLGYDPHGNSFQTKRVANATMKYIESSGLLVRISGTIKTM